MPFSSATFPTPDGEVGTVHFFRSIEKTENSLLELVGVLSKGDVTNTSQMVDWLNNNGYWTEWEASTGYIYTVGVNSTTFEEGIWVLDSNLNETGNFYDLQNIYNSGSEGTIFYDDPHPREIKVASDGKIYIIDIGYGVRAFRLNSDFSIDETFINPTQYYLNLSGIVSFPESIEVDDSGNMFIGDRTNTIFMFDSSGTFMGSTGLTELNNDLIGGICFYDNRYYVTDKSDLYVYDKNWNYDNETHDLTYLSGSTTLGANNYGLTKTPDGWITCEITYDEFIIYDNDFNFVSRKPFGVASSIRGLNYTPTIRVTGTTTTTTTTTLAPTTTTTTTIELSYTERHKLSLGELNNTFEGVSSTWQNVSVDFDTTPLIILDEDGINKGLTLKIPESTDSMNIRKKTLNTIITSGDADFPDVVLLKGYDSYGAFISQSKNAIIRISGFTNDTYTFKIFCSVDNSTTGWSTSDADYTGLKLVGGGTDDISSLNPINNTSNTIILSNTPDANGIIDLEFYGDEDWDHPVVNAIIITK